MKGTLLNTGTIAAGAGVGLAIGRFVPPSCEQVAMEGLGLVVSLIGVRMFLQTKNAVIIVAAVSLGGVIGVTLGISSGLTFAAEWMKGYVGRGDSHFNEAIIVATVLYCVGPMTILGCLQDGIEGNFEILATKSVLDGISSVFLAATLGFGVMLTAGIVLLVQGSLTLLSRPLQKFLSDESAITEASAAGGAMILGIGLNLLNIKNMHVENYLPALFLAPAFLMLSQRFLAKEKGAA